MNNNVREKVDNLRLIQEGIPLSVHLQEGGENLSFFIWE